MTRKKHNSRQKHVPQRTCIACRRVEDKRGLIRLVRTDVGIEVDPTGKKPGRGAYLHPYQKCWMEVLHGNRVEQALRTRFSDENRKALLEFMADLPKSAEEKASTRLIEIDLD
jgi:predicted RNA-binding protein YlxR (DUF448 family)